MNLVLYSDKIDEYLKQDDVIDYENEAIAELADTLSQKADNEIDYIEAAYEFVRDHISHSADIGEDAITCTASEVLKAGHGICFAKSHLLAALLRSKSIPAGFCYQKLILDDETAPVLIYHGLNGVYVKDYKKWIRLDARGNKAGVNAEFSVETEQLAFAVRPEMGEEDSLIVYPDPDLKVLEKLRKSKTRTELWNDLPTELGYNMVKEEIRYIQTSDKDFWFSLDRHLPETEFDKKVRDRQGYVLLRDGKPLSLLRYNLFWDNTPFCTMLYVAFAFQRQGYGKKLMEYWEKDMKARGYSMVLTSTQVDEQAQHFYRKLGYKDCGGFVVDIAGQEQPMELFLIKALTGENI